MRASLDRFRFRLRLRARDALLWLLRLVDGPRWSPHVKVRLAGSPTWTTIPNVKRVEYRRVEGGEHTHAVLVDLWGNETLYRLDEVVGLQHFQRDTPPPSIQPVQVAWS